MQVGHEITNRTKIKRYINPELYKKEIANIDKWGGGKGL
jgi:hypothetical protein